MIELITRKCRLSTRNHFRTARSIRLKKQTPCRKGGILSSCFWNGTDDGSGAYNIRNHLQKEGDLNQLPFLSSYSDPQPKRRESFPEYIIFHLNQLESQTVTVQPLANQHSWHPNNILYFILLCSCFLGLHLGNCPGHEQI